MRCPMYLGMAFSGRTLHIPSVVEYLVHVKVVNRLLMITTSFLLHQFMKLSDVEALSKV